MKIKIIRSKFIEGLKKVQNIVAGKGSLQIIQNAMLDAKDGKLSLVTTDLDISIKSTVECEIVEAGATTLPVKLLSSTIASYKSDYFTGKQSPNNGEPDQYMIEGHHEGLVDKK